jgi:hypothetical protein
VGNSDELAELEGETLARLRTAPTKDLLVLRKQFASRSDSERHAGLVFFLDRILYHRRL